MPLTTEDWTFLIALNASEEASLLHLNWDLVPRGCDPAEIRELLSKFHHEGFFDLVYVAEGVDCPLKPAEIVRLVDSWPEEASVDVEFRLTDAGATRWRTEDWGLTAERAQYLMFEHRPGRAPAGRNRQEG